MSKKQITPMPVSKLIKMLLEMDSAWRDPRPSPFGEAIVTIEMLADHAEGSLRGLPVDDYEDIDVSEIYK